ncbi:MAG TPA: asparagine synthase (glutamine-hydrolyzing) [Azospirillaceae bacterium]|nr:asparagine synthase (glutamine-hydrolyzing) [Azospirillaceae bacterium]
MCGIAGFFDFSGRTPDPAAVACTMADAVAHRGPDDAGTWGDPAVGIGFGHRRLAIVDLSPGGAQPMASNDGRYVLTYNGEIYNFAEIRDELAATGVAFRSKSDTEVLLEACARWGAAEAARRANGIFAFALWDRLERRLWLARDHMGVKPLFWGLNGGVLLFGSELKALAAHPAWTAEVNPAAVAAFLRYGYVPAPASIWKGVHKLEPGCLLSVAAGEAPRIGRFWDLPAVAAAGQADRLDLSDEEAADRLDALLRQAVSRQMLSDVPLGAFLSGGIDSSTVVALMQAQSPRPVRTFTVGFDAAGYDEAKDAAAVARHLGTDHTEMYVGEAEALDVVPRLPDMYDEPFADSSQIPTHLVSALARRHVTVALSGDGGDELFAGYNRYAWAERVWSVARRLPPGAGPVLGGAVRAVPPGMWDRLGPGVARAGDKLHKAAGLLSAGSREEIYRRLVAQWDGPLPVRGGFGEVPSRLDDPALAAATPDFLRWMQLADALTYLPDDVLAKVDRASMAVALEARVPLLDPDVVAFAWRLPVAQTLRDGRTKWLLRQVLGRYVPASLTDRPKMGFGVPLGDWLRGPLRGWAEDLLSPNRLAGQGLLDAGLVRRHWAEHVAGRRNRAYGLWSVLMLQAWLDRWAGASPARDEPGAVRGAA